MYMYQQCTNPFRAHNTVQPHYKAQQYKSLYIQVIWLLQWTGLSLTCGRYVSSLNILPNQMFWTKASSRSSGLLPWKWKIWLLCDDAFSYIGACHFSPLQPYLLVVTTTPCTHRYSFYHGFVTFDLLLFITRWLLEMSFLCNGSYL